MQGTGGNFTPQGTVTKAQVAQVIYNALGLKAGAPAKFSDVPAGQWYTDAVNALAEKGIATGTEKGTFEPNKNVTLAEAAQMLSKALEIKGTADLSKFADASAVPTWANEAIQALVSNGYIKGGEVNGKLSLDPLGNLTRERLATMFVNIAKGELEEGPVTTATKIASVTATNLKQVVVTFDGTVDKETAEDKANYALKSGKTIRTATLLEDGKTVVLTLEVGTTLNNNRAEALSVANVKAGETTVSVSNFEFKVFDNEIPVVTGVTSLGTKAVKVTFSEPVNNVKQANFTLDGKAFYGKVTVIGNEVVLTPYSSSALAVGEHTLQIAKVEDFAGFTSLTSTNEFTVVEDKDAPTVTETSATLEALTITFSEDVDTDTIAPGKVYWKSGDTKKAAYAYDVLAGNKVRYYFKDDNTLPTGSVAVYVEGVKDYSGNEIAKDTKVVVTPEIDQTRPEVKKVEVVDSKNLKVTFSKALEATTATNTNNYTVLNKDGKVISVKEVTLSSDGKTVNVELYSNLSTGKNTLTVKNVKDKTKLQNTMLDFSQEVNVADSAAPKIDSKVWNNSNRQVVIKFSEKMDIETITNYSNYHVKVAGNYRALTSSIADIEVLQDGTAVAITFVEKIGSLAVAFGTGSVEELQLLALKDTTGNLLSEFTSNTGNKIDFTSAASFSLGEYEKISNVIYNAALVDRKTIEVKFDFPIDGYQTNAFTATGNEIASIEVNGTSTVKVKFKENIDADGANISLAVDYSKLVTLAGSGATGGATISIAQSSNAGKLLDLVAPTVNGTEKYVVDSAAKTITVPFTEALTLNGVTAGLAAQDFKVTGVSDNTVLKAGVDYSVSLANSDKDVVITLTDGDTTVDGSLYRVEVVANAKYISDKSDAVNYISATSTRETTGKIDQVNPTIASVAIVQKDGNSTINANDQIVVTFTENLSVASGTLSAAILDDFVLSSGSFGAATASVSGNKVTITAAADTTITLGTTTINIGSGTIDLKDIVGNAVTPLGTALVIE